ncbi:small ribosomal subunit protein uS17-like [Lepus europaeus]|uniref:small ribosomal subunit protein uS17-like n=1 Tax=Lepus europaeus TaxID=9983 RepID=UPI002B45B591|nr:small ribosomal subunit protein uS17-like [Lepus europaeus]
MRLLTFHKKTRWRWQEAADTPTEPTSFRTTRVSCWEKPLRSYKDRGVGFRTPTSLPQRRLPRAPASTRNISVRSWSLAGVVTMTPVIPQDSPHCIREYNHFAKHHGNMTVHLSPCFRDVQIGNVATMGECQPLSKTVCFRVPEVLKAPSTNSESGCPLAPPNEMKLFSH